MAEGQNERDRALAVPSRRQELLRIARDVAVTSVGLVAAFYLSVHQLADSFGFDTSAAKDLGFLGFVAVGAVAVPIGLGISLVRLWRRVDSYEGAVAQLAAANPASQKLSGELVSAVEALYEEKNYVEVIRFGRYLSRSLWLSGLYRQRVTIGKLIEESAARTEATEAQVAALIDDLGWTNAVLGDLEEAEKNIHHGIELAVEQQLTYYAAKGWRHLAGICYRYRDDREQAEQLLAKAFECAASIQGTQRKNEMLAGLHYAKAEFLIAREAYGEAMPESKAALELYEALVTEGERMVKCQSQMGRIYLGLRELDRAKDAFRRGLSHARKLKRRDEVASSLLGLAQVHLADANFSSAAQASQESLEIFESLDMKREITVTAEIRAEAIAQMATKPRR